LNAFTRTAVFFGHRYAEPSRRGHRIEKIGGEFAGRIFSLPILIGEIAAMLPY
jgi:hypothetical protein